MTASGYPIQLRPPPLLFLRARATSPVCGPADAFIDPNQRNGASKTGTLAACITLFSTRPTMRAAVVRDSARERDSARDCLPGTAAGIS